MYAKAKAIAAETGRPVEAVRSALRRGTDPAKPRQKSNQRRPYKPTLADEVYDVLLAEQGGVCAVCGHPPKVKKLALDHDHKTGKLRGLLCYACNYVLGFWHDNPARFEQAATYLRSGEWVIQVGRSSTYIEDVTKLNQPTA